MTCEDLGLETSAVEQAKLEYSSLGKIFNKGSDEEELLKRLKNIEGKNKKQLKAIEDHGKNNQKKLKTSI